MGVDCNTCGRTESKHLKMVDTPLLIVCVDCATESFLVSHPELTPKKKSFRAEIGYSTKDIYQKLGKTVIGQDKAKKTLAVALMNHMKRIVSDRTIEKTNVLLIGPTGTGKTALVKALAEHTSLPLGIADATTITANGWIGDDPETVLVNLLQNAANKETAQNGIVFIDEIDKLYSPKGDRNRAGNAQQGLLKLLEGAVVGVPTGQNSKEFVDTSNILFICAGAFGGLQDIIDARKTTKSIGFHSNQDKEDFTDEDATTEDLERYGFLSEFLGRIPSRVKLDNLDAHQLRMILTKEDNSLTSQYVRMFDLDDIKLEFSSTGLEEIAKQALALKTGARGLKTILEKVLFDYQYECEETKLYITRDVVLDKLGLKEELSIGKSLVQSRNR